MCLRKSVPKPMKNREAGCTNRVGPACRVTQCYRYSHAAIYRLVLGIWENNRYHDWCWRPMQYYRIAIILPISCGYFTVKSMLTLKEWPAWKCRLDNLYHFPRQHNKLFWVPCASVCKMCCKLSYGVQTADPRISVTRAILTPGQSSTKIDHWQFRKSPMFFPY